LLAHNGFPVEYLPDSDCCFFVVEGYDDAAHRLEWAPRVDGGGGVNEVFDSLKVVGSEYLRIL
jgi:hypothetical protein